MLLAARDAMEFLAGIDIDSFRQDRMRQLAVIKSIEVIGEAASRITQPCRETYPELPWTAIIAMRHRLVHGYFEVDVDRVYSTVREDLPGIIPILERTAPSPDA